MRHQPQSFGSHEAHVPLGALAMSANLVAMVACGDKQERNNEKVCEWVGLQRADVDCGRPDRRQCQFAVAILRRLLRREYDEFLNS